MCISPVDEINYYSLFKEQNESKKKNGMHWIMNGMERKEMNGMHRVMNRMESKEQNGMNGM